MPKRLNPYSLEQPEGFGGGAAPTGKRVVNLLEKESFGGRATAPARKRVVNLLEEEADKQTKSYVRSQAPAIAAGAVSLGGLGAALMGGSSGDKAKSAKQTPTTAEQQMIQEERDRQMAPKLEKAYNESLTSTSPPQKKAKGGVTRADGCISKGHTRGKMVSMGG